MTIRSICNTKVVTAEKDQTLKEISVLMRKHHVGSVVVIDLLNGKKIPIGIITDRDLALAMGASENAQDLEVGKLILYKVVTVKVSDGVLEATELMRNSGVKRLVVVNNDDSLCGIVSADDLLGLMGDEVRNLSKIQEIQIKKEQGIRTPSERHMNL